MPRRHRPVDPEDPTRLRRWWPLLAALALSLVAGGAGAAVWGHSLLTGNVTPRSAPVAAAPGPAGQAARNHHEDSTPTAEPSPSADPSPTAEPTPAAEPSPTAEPTPTATPKPAVPRSTTHLTLSGAISGEMQVVGVNCQQHIPEGDGGYMSVTGTVGGTTRMVSIWSHGPAPGTLVDAYEGTQPGEIDDMQSPYASGITGFDWAKGATLDIDLAAATSGATPGGPTLHVSGHIVCP